MARLSRLEVPGQPHLVIQRGIGGQPVFIDDADRRGYLEALIGAARTTRVGIHAYALTTDSTFLLVTPGQSGALGRCMQRVGRGHAAAFNRRHSRVGALWAGRFGAAVVEPERYLLASMRFVEQAPVRCGAVAEPLGWPWSSAGHHVGRQTSPWIIEHPVYWSTGNTPFEREARYGTELQEPLGDALLALFGRAVLRGWPVGSVEYVAGLGAVLRGRQTQPRPRGRPRRLSLVNK